MKDFFFLKVWAKNVGVHYAQEHVTRNEIWYSLGSGASSSFNCTAIKLFVKKIVYRDFQ